MKATPVLLFDIDRALIQKAQTQFKAFCKIGKHGIPAGKPTVWLRSPHPVGLSCLPCARPVAPEEVRAELERVEPAKPDLTNYTHGKVGTYNKGCRCTPCRAANTARSVEYKRARRERRAAS